MKKLSFIILLVFLITIMIFGTVVSAEDGEFVISNLKEKDITISVEKLKELPVVEKDVTSVDSSGDEDDYTVKGALFSDFLESINASKEDLKAMQLIAGDGYSIEIPEPVLKNRQIILVYEINGEPLPDKVKPVRVIIPEERAMYWIKNLTKINIIEMVKTVDIDSLVVLETAVNQVEKVDYTYYESEDKAVNVANLVDQIGLNTDKRTIAFTAADGYEKDEQVDIFRDGYIKITGDHAPMFLSPDIPKGMYVKDVLYVGYGSTSLASIDSAMKAFATTTIDGTEGVTIAKVIKEAGLISADKYKLTASDGYSVEVSSKDIENGIVYLENGEMVRCAFSDLSKKFWIKNLYKIEPIK